MQSLSSTSIMAVAGSSRLSSDMTSFRAEFFKAKNVIVLSGAGVSAESGVPTFRGAGGYWRKWQAQDLASPAAFRMNPSLVWEFYHYRREVMRTKNPNPAHLAIAECEERLKREGRKLSVITQNIDELHKRAGSRNVIELHGSLFRTRCLGCGKVERNMDSPICEALRDKGAPDTDANDARIPATNLPKCGSCGAMVRPDVIWFGEGLDDDILSSAWKELERCDICLVVGTSSVVYPAAMFAPTLAEKGITVAEFNLEHTPATYQFKYHFCGKAGELVPKALAPENT